MKVLVINCGSSSLKYDLFDLDREKNLFSGAVDRIGLEGSSHRFGRGPEVHTEQVPARDHPAALELALSALAGQGQGPLGDLAEIGAAAHRVAHGGLRYRSPVIIDDEVKAQIERLIPLLPLHHPHMLAGIQAGERAMPGIPQVAVFDTSFHRTLPDEATVYGLPYELFRDQGVRKFGFHGNSHEFAAEAAARHLETPLHRLRVITCHLGNGASMCAVQRGKSIDTSMGFSPLQGLIMGTRVGDLDPGIIPYLARTQGMSIEQIDEMMNRRGGLLGLSGVSSDMRDILKAAEDGDPRALLTIKAFCYRVKLYIGAYSAAMGGVDALVFTGGIGQNSRGIRARCVQGLERLGMAIDHRKNVRAAVDDQQPVYDLTAGHSRVNVLVVACDEELMIARQCAKALRYQRSIHHDLLSTDRRPLRVSVSAHHLHLCRKDVEALFGRGHRLTEKARLYIDSQFASEETVNLIGPRGRVDRVRVLGPERSRTQVEISRTEEFKLGIDAPIRASGDLEGSPGIVLEGPAGTVDLPQGVICAQRHIHMSPADAELYGVKDGDKVMVKIEGERELIFGDVLIRVRPDYKLEMHIDTDEANAAELPPVSSGYLVMIQHRGEPT